MNILYPDVTVNLVGGTGNAFGIIGKVTGALRRAGVKDPEIDKFTAEATSGNYDNVLRTCMKWVNVT